MIAEFIKGKRIIAAALISGGVMVAVYFLLGCWVADSELYLFLGMVVAWMSGIVLLAWRELHVHIRKQTLEMHRWQEAWYSIRDLLTFDHPLPPSTTYTISPDAALFILRSIIEEQPKLIVELGGGLSTILMSRLIKKTGLECRIVTIESDQAYGEELVRQLQYQGTAELVDLQICPIVQKEGSAWYDVSPQVHGGIDLLLIDGPPKSVARDSRYPALPFFSDKMSPNGIIIADDADRRDMQRTIRRWGQDFPEWRSEIISLSRAIAVFRKA